jgi:hypothetical protein
MKNFGGAKRAYSGAIETISRCEKAVNGVNAKKSQV